MVFTGSWCSFAGSWRFSVFFLLVPGVVLLVLGGFQWFLMVLGGFQWFLRVSGVVLLVLGGFQWFLLVPSVVLLVL